MISKKNILIKSLFLTILFIAIYAIFNFVNAAEVKLNYKVDIDKDYYEHILAEDDEFWIGIVLSDVERVDNITLSADIEYNDNVIEIVKNDKSKNRAEVRLGKNATEGYCDIDSKKIYAKTKSESNNEEIMYIKFRVKEGQKNVNTNVNLKSISVRKNYTSSVYLNSESTSITLSIGKKLTKVGGIVFLILLVVVVISTPILLVVLVSVIGKRKLNSVKEELRLKIDDANREKIIAMQKEQELNEQGHDKNDDEFLK